MTWILKCFGNHPKIKVRWLSFKNEDRKANSTDLIESASLCIFKNLHSLSAPLFCYIDTVINPKFQASSNLLWLYSTVCAGPGRKPGRPVFSWHGLFCVSPCFRGVFVGGYQQLQIPHWGPHSCCWGRRRTRVPTHHRGYEHHGLQPGRSVRYTQRIIHFWFEIYRNDPKFWDR